VQYWKDGKAVTVERVPPRIPFQYANSEAVVQEAAYSLAQAEKLFSEVLKLSMQFNVEMKDKSSAVIFKETLEGLEKQSQAASYDPVQKALTWLGNIGAILGAVAGIIIGAAAAPFSCGGSIGLVLVSAFALAQTLAKTAGDIAREVGHDVGDISLGRGVAEMWVGIVSATDTPDGKRLREDSSYRQTVMTGISIATEVITSLACVAAGAGAGKIVAKAAELAETITRVQKAAMTAVVRMMDDVLQATEALSSIAQSSIGLHQARLRTDSSNHMAHKSFEEQKLAMLHAIWEDFSNVLRNAVQTILKALEGAHITLEQSHESTMAVQKNIVTNS
jgi:hypothetical protein